MENHYVYEITNKINGMKYIGKRTCHCEIEEDNNYLGSGINISAAIKKYGKDNFDKKIIKTFKTSKEAFEYERYIIEKIKAYEDDNYYNIAHGGLGNHKGYIITEEVKKKILHTKMINGTTSEGEKNGMYGRYGRSNPVSKKAIMFDKDLNIVKIFECLREANDYLDKSRAFSYISRQCVKGGGDAYGYIFMFYEDYLYEKENYILDNHLNELQKKLIIKNQRNELNKKEIYEINIEEINIINTFKNIDEICLWYKDIDRKSVKRVLCHGANTVQGLSFIFKDEYEKLTKEEIYKLYHNKNIGKHIPHHKQCKAVRCVNNGMIFQNKKEASEYFGYKDLPIDKVCNGKREYCGKDPVSNKKLFWEYV